MPTCRAAINDALRAIKVLAPGDMAHIDALNAGLSAIQDLTTEFHEARGPLVDVDVTTDWIANEGQRCRVQAGDTVTVSLPNSIPVMGAWDPFDYGFNPGVTPTFPPSQGSTAAADGAVLRQPRDGARIEIVGTTQALFFYRADLNQWMSVYDMALDSEMPFNRRYAGPLGTLLAERLMDELTINEPSVAFLKRAGLARATMFLRMGTQRSPVMAEYL